VKAVGEDASVLTCRWSIAMNKPVHVAITRKVKPGCEAEFEDAIRRFFSDSIMEKVSLGALLIRPLAGTQNRIYGILRSFASEKDREAFYNSINFRKWDESVKSLVEEDYTRQNLHRLEAFFTDPDLIHHPPRWKMALVTWIGVWPTVYAISSAISPQLSGLHPALATGFVTLIVVLALTWAVMPVLTRLARSWLRGAAGVHEQKGPVHERRPHTA
jgi:antibiotic biosynthesis monooxygenase (ABM) superfamily enzyme